MGVLPPITPNVAGPRQLSVPFVSRTEETPTTATFEFSTAGSGFAYRSNQAIRMYFPEIVDDRPWRVFSLSSSPSETDRLAVTVKMTRSPFKQALASLAPGDRVPIYGPTGDLFYNPTRPAVFIAGGIGVTPFRGMLRYAADTGITQRAILLYSARVPEEFAFRREFDEITRAHPSLEVRYTITRPEESAEKWSGRVGRPDLAWIREATEGLDRPKVYVAGLPEMARQTVALLKEQLGFAEDDLEYEYFLGYRTPARGTAPS